MDIDIRPRRRPSEYIIPVAGHGVPHLAEESALVLDLGNGDRVFLVPDQAHAILESGLQNWLTRSQRVELVANYIR